jgi:UDP-N-acetylmuramoylalanine--D-glutamate ligase
MVDRYKGSRITVMGLGTRDGGTGVARWLVDQGAIVTVTDAKTGPTLEPSIAALKDLPIRFVLGGHDPKDFTPEGTDLVVRNPGVPRTAKMLSMARESGIPVEMEMTLFLRNCPAPVIGITGTKGKTTTATLCASMLREWDPCTVLAGNMGVSALGQLARIIPNTPVVLELSSWQVEGLIEHHLSPAIAVITNIAEDHLDHYDSFTDYASTKRGLVWHQRPENVAILNMDDPEVWGATRETAARIIPFGLNPRPQIGAWLDGNRLVWRQDGETHTLSRPDSLSLAGQHGAANALAAMAAAFIRGAPPHAVERALVGFTGVRDRMEQVAEIGGIHFINDTAATAPAATQAALRSLAGRRIHLILGGSDKKLNLEPLAEAAAAASSRHLLAGTATPRLRELLAARVPGPLIVYDDMHSAVAAAVAEARDGDVVLLSPGCASFGLFQDEFERGQRFRDAVATMSTTDPARRTADLPLS